MQFFQYMDVATFIIILLAIFAAIVLINNAVKALKELATPVTNLRTEINSLRDELGSVNQRLDKVDEKLLRDYQVMAQEHELDRLLLKTVRQLVVHEIDGNNIKELESLKKEIDEYLYEHA